MKLLRMNIFYHYQEVLMDIKKLKFKCAIYMGNYGVNVYSNYSKIFNTLNKGSFIPFIPGYRCVGIKALSKYSYSVFGR